MFILSLSGLIALSFALLAFHVPFVSWFMYSLLSSFRVLLLLLYDVHIPSSTDIANIFLPIHSFLRLGGNIHGSKFEALIFYNFFPAIEEYVEKRSR